MFPNNMLSSLHSAALALTLAAALPAFAQSGTGMRTLETHGAATGDWVPATSSMPGSMHGRMVDATGAPRFEIFAVTHVSVPEVVSGYDLGTMYGRLMSERLQGDAQDPKLVEQTKPVVNPASIYVLGRWSASQKTGAGSFSATAFLEIDPLPLPIVLLDIAGSFEMRPQVHAASLAGPESAAESKSSGARAVPFVARWVMR